MSFVARDFKYDYFTTLKEFLTINDRENRLTNFPQFLPSNKIYETVLK